jgi:hypothetical protein
VFGDIVEYVERIDADVCLWICEANECIIEEDVEPLLVELLLLPNEEGLACIHDLLVSYIVLQVLHYLDALVQVVVCVAVYQLTHVLSLIRALLDDLAVVLEQVVDEELVELISGALLILIDFSCESFAENQGVYKATRHRLQLA